MHCSQKPRPIMLWLLVSCLSLCYHGFTITICNIMSWLHTVWCPVYNPLSGIISHCIITELANNVNPKTPPGTVGIIWQWKGTFPHLRSLWALFYIVVVTGEQLRGWTMQYLHLMCTCSREHMKKQTHFLVIYALLSLCKVYIVYNNWLLLISGTSNSIK